MEYREQIEWLRGFEIDHSPDGWPAIRMREISAMCDAIESLLAENERLNHNLTTTEQTKRQSPRSVSTVGATAPGSRENDGLFTASG